ncbi:NmrA/HSCARG family protein [Saccharothrix sp. NPDC042600]|uniref:NmrA/HSCARG family protein n=1 Tax=Saccharothrix TaxID=2071 RepID=UPI0033FB1189|nr:NmrA/HSCARG family protein [Saccharothrix mutabilis subsp. capreolus]
MDLVVVTGATGRQGGAVARHLLAAGWRVRALTRDPAAPAARRLADLGVEVVRGDMADHDSLRPVFRGAHGVFSVQNPMISGHDGEIHQGRTVGNAAAEAGVRHLVYGSAGTGRPGTGVGSWESKVVVKAHLHSLGVPLTVLRPMAFMELMTDRDFYPPVSTWHLMPKLMGPDRPVPWLCVDDLGAVAARAFAEPDRFVGLDLALAGDVRTIDECREQWRGTFGKAPKGFPMPVWLFHRFVGPDPTTMWRWLRTNPTDVDPARTREVLPEARTVAQFLAERRA